MLFWLQFFVALYLDCKVLTVKFTLPPSFSPGQQRSRMLATLFKDERCQQLAAYGILEKMYLDRIIRGNQLQEFAAMLMPHQKATMADGQSLPRPLSTVLKLFY